MKRNDDVRDDFMLSDMNKPQLLPNVGPTEAHKINMQVGAKGVPNFASLIRHKEVDLCALSQLGENVHLKFAVKKQKFPMPDDGEHWWANYFLSLFPGNLLYLLSLGIMHKMFSLVI